MNYRILGRNEIEFSILANDSEIIEMLSFVHLVRMKFEGDENSCGWFQAEGNEKYIIITLGFSSILNTRDAFSHCNAHINKSGTVSTAYKGALLRADPGHAIANNTLKKALSNML